jgi:hypothetical protein
MVKAVTEASKYALEVRGFVLYPLVRLTVADQ